MIFTVANDTRVTVIKMSELLAGCVTGGVRCLEASE